MHDFISPHLCNGTHRHTIKRCQNRNISANNRNRYIGLDVELFRRAYSEYSLQTLAVAERDASLLSCAIKLFIASKSLSASYWLYSTINIIAIKMRYKIEDEICNKRYGKVYNVLKGVDDAITHLWLFRLKHVGA